MFWQEQRASPEGVAAEITDLAFRVRCACLPVEHAHALSEALCGHLPWLADEPRAGIHSIHGAASGNGWMRPQSGTEALLSLSRRTRLVLRVPRHRLGDVRSLEGTVLVVAGFRVEVGAAAPRILAPQPEQFARRVLGGAGESEADFMHRVAAILDARGIPPRKLLCGRCDLIDTPRGTRRTRSLLVAGLLPAEALSLQLEPLGDGRLLGCGLFVPHKAIAPVGDEPKGA